MNRDFHIGKEIDILSNKFKRVINHKISKYGVTGIQGKIIGFIKFESVKRDVFQKDIEEEFDIRRSSVTSVITLLEKKGYVRRVSVLKDARLKKLVLTEKGLELHSKVHNDIDDFENYVKDELTEDEMNLFIDILNRVNKRIEE
ncbi:Transcriptional regulator, MarR family [Clostridium bornimense]|uniref:Transcriptional regulator, MarR family n=1 Tax=Clostridium bornimense TaxID=1216932 RepID=W6RZX1_9CLOT|nr:MarR family transcriptional regulator [Clostridium bornimense]CDM70206.1 Transcriptional regulator, MarR family [Clostridium bornimense]